MLEIRPKQVSVLREMITREQSTHDNLFGLFEQIANTSGRNDKMSLLAQADYRQKDLLKYALDAQKQFHITKWNTGIKYIGSVPFASDGQAYIEFIDMLEYAMKQNHCSELVDRFSKFFSRCNSLQAKWFDKIVQKDLSFGLQVKSINKVFPDLIPSYSVMLAEKAEADYSNVIWVKHLDKKRAWMEYKYDGFRVTVVFRKNGSVDVSSRSGKTIPNIEFNKRLIEVGQTEHFKGKVLDGEGYCHSLPFEGLSSVLRSEDAPLPADFQFVVFDILTEEEWDAQDCDYSNTFESRLEQRQNSVHFYSVDSNDDDIPDRLWLTSAIGTYVYSNEDIQRVYDAAIEAGYEGGMVKNLNGLYEFKRSRNILKVKPIDFVDVQITGYYEGKGAIQGKLGGFTCEDAEGHVINIGGGFKLWEREKFWAERESMMGKWIETKFTERTEAQKLRHGNFRSLRPDK